jgi:glycerol-3-phosphate dehydrogenase
VVDAKRLDVRHAVVMLGRRDRRVVFAIPWGDRTVIGTTDTDHPGDRDSVYATRDDAQYLLETTNHYFPSLQLGLPDVLATWAGLRPLVKPDRSFATESDTSREHHVLERPGFLTIAGGKLTTYRRMAAEVVDRAGAQLGRIPVSQTAERPLPGGEGIEDDQDLVRIGESLIARGMEAPVARSFALTYGSRAPAVARRAEEDPSAAHRLDPELPYTLAQVDEAVEHEMARTLTDVLARRMQLLLRGRDQGLAAAPQVAQRMARRLLWSEARTREEIDRYRATVDETRRFRE